LLTDPEINNTDDSNFIENEETSLNDINIDNEAND
jgi:hypothetical protein